MGHIPAPFEMAFPLLLRSLSGGGLASSLQQAVKAVKPERRTALDVETTGAGLGSLGREYPNYRSHDNYVGTDTLYSTAA